MQRIIFHSFLMGDVDDPELYAAIPLGEFMDTDKGKWIKQNCLDPMYRISNDHTTYSVKVVVYGEVEDKLATEYYLRWNKGVY